MSALHRPTPAGPQHGNRQAQVRRAAARPVRHTIAMSTSTHTRATQSPHPSSTIFILRQCNLSDRPSLRPDRLDEQPSASSGVPFRTTRRFERLAAAGRSDRSSFSGSPPFRPAHRALPRQTRIRQTATPSAPPGPGRRRPRTPGPWRRRRRAASSPRWREGRSPPLSKRTQHRRESRRSGPNGQATRRNRPRRSPQEQGPILDAKRPAWAGPPRRPPRGWSGRPR